MSTTATISLDRLQSWQYSDPQRQLARSYSYDSRGNITHKSDAGSMSYAANNRLQSRVDPTGANHTYLYDANGNMQSGDGRSYTWTSFNKVARVSQSGHQVDYRYDSEQNRVSRQANGQTTYYITPGLELVTETDANGEVINRARHNIFVDGQVVATYEKTLVGTTETPDKVAYIHRDALGSVDTVTDSHGNVVMRNQFVPYGENLSANEPSPAFRRHELRGYTGHESVAETGLINMNARLYDPVIGRFISADSVVPEPGMGMAYNRYMYVLGNPLKYNDPSGHWVEWVVAAVFYIIGSTTDDPQVRTVSFAVATALLIANPVFTTSSFAGAGVSATSAAAAAAVANGAIVGFANGYFASGGDFGAAFEGGIIGGITNGVNFAINGGSLFGVDAFFSNTIARGLFQGLIAESQGGKFKRGFVNDLIGGVGGQYLRATGLDNNIILRGLLSKAAGGSFISGAVQGAISFLNGYTSSAGKISPKDITRAKLADGVYDPNFGGVDGYSVVKRFDREAIGFKAALFVKGDDYILAFSETDATSLANWKANFLQAFGFESGQYTRGINVAIAVYNRYSNVSFTGHSLGGGIALAASVVTGGPAIVFNAAGVHENTVARYAGSLSGAPVRYYYGSLDILRLGNALTPASVPGNQHISLGFAGLHTMSGICGAIGC